MGFIKINLLNSRSQS